MPNEERARANNGTVQSLKLLAEDAKQGHDGVGDAYEAVCCLTEELAFALEELCALTGNQTWSAVISRKLGKKPESWATLHCDATPESPLTGDWVFNTLER